VRFLLFLFSSCAGVGVELKGVMWTGAMAWSEDCLLAVGGRGEISNIVALDVEADEPNPIHLGRHEGAVTSLTFCRDSHLLSSSGSDGMHSFKK